MSVDALGGADEHSPMATQRLRFTAKLQPQRRGWLGVQLPPAPATALATRSQARVRTTIRGVSFDTVAFPDGKGGHFVPVNAQLRRRLDLAEGERVEVAIERVAPRPPAPIPDELRAELSRSQAAQVPGMDSRRPRGRSPRAGSAPRNRTRHVRTERAMSCDARSATIPARGRSTRLTRTRSSSASRDGGDRGSGTGRDRFEDDALVPCAAGSR
jgi:hypothetical protein